MDIKAFETKHTFKRDRAGKRIPTGEEHVMNPLVEYVKPYVLVPDNSALNPTNPEQIVVPASGRSADVRLKMLDEGLFEAAYMTAIADPYDDLSFELIDDQRRVSLTGRPCHVNTVLGNGERPFVLPESIPVDKRQSLLVRFHNLRNDETKIRFQLHGQRIYSEQVRDPKLDRYIERRRMRNQNMSVYMCPLDIDPIVLAGGAVDDFYFTNDYNFYFEVRKITVYPSSAPTDIKFQVIDEKNIGMSSGWSDLWGASGSAQYPFIFYGPWMIEPGGKITFRIQNYGVDEKETYLTLSGRQHFVYPGS